MPQPPSAESLQEEGRILLALDAIKRGQFKSIRKAAASYDVNWTTLRNRTHGMTSRQDSTPNSRKLTSQEELAIVRYILELDSRGFSPRPQDVREMADLLLSERDASPVGKNWTTNFIKRRTELKSKFNRKYDYQRAQCEDPVIIEGWFQLVRNTIAKYGIVDEDIYNFDEAGFQMGVIGTARVVTSSEARNRPKKAQPGNREWVSIIQGISSYGWPLPPFIIFKGQSHLQAWYEESGLPGDWVITLSENGWTTNEIGYEWIQHFDRHTKNRTKGNYRLLVLDGHESHISAQFQKYCTDNKIIALCMPAHSSHLLQPLDVGCFSPLKSSYGKQIEKFMRLRINHITKLEFLPAFKEAFKAAFTDQNIKSGFRATGLVPYDLEAVLSTLDLKLRTPTPPPIENTTWTSKTPYDLPEFERQTAHIKERIVQHQDSSPSAINEAVNQLIKGTQIIVHSAVLLKAEVKILQEANQAKERRKRKQRKRIVQGGSLTVQEGEQLIENGAIQAQIQNEVAGRIVRSDGSAGKQRRCRNCNQFGHNIRTCKEIEDSICN